jgi:hypothetical protein
MDSDHSPPTTTRTIQQLSPMAHCGSKRRSDDDSSNLFLLNKKFHSDDDHSRFILGFRSYLAKFPNAQFSDYMKARVAGTWTKMSGIPFTLHDNTLHAFITQLFPKEPFVLNLYTPEGQGQGLCPIDGFRVCYFADS